MTNADAPKSQQESRDVRSMLSAVLSAGKSTVRKLGADEIRRFIEAQPGIVGAVKIDRLRGAGEVGGSSGIVLFTATYDTGSGAVTRDLVLRHAPGSETRLFFEYDLSRQFRVQRAMQGSGVPVPEPLWLDADGRYLGVPGFIMVLTPGVTPHPDAFTRGPIAEASAEQRQQMIDEVMQALVGIHRTEIKACGLEDFLMNAPGDTPLQRLINWYWRTWEFAKLAQHERLVPVYRWLLAQAPDGEPELMHGDSTLHNYLFREHHMVGVLDWEMSSLGRAECDLALQCVGNQVFAPPAGSGLPMPPSDEEWLALYRKAGGRELEHFDFYKKLAAFTIVVTASSLLRTMPDEVRKAQEPLLIPCWKILEA